jgi:hypothetical protein
VAGRGVITSDLQRARCVHMSLPMVLWMRHRGHSWERGGEMVAATVLPVLPFLACAALPFVANR